MVMTESNWNYSQRLHYVQLVRGDIHTVLRFRHSEGLYNPILWELSQYTFIKENTRRNLNCSLPLALDIEYFVNTLLKASFVPDPHLLAH